MKRTTFLALVALFAAPLAADDLSDVRRDIVAAEQRLGRLLAEIRTIENDIALARQDQEAATAPIEVYAEYQASLGRMADALATARASKQKLEELLGWNKKFTGWNPLEYVSSWLLTNVIPDDRQGYVEQHRAVKNEIRRAESALDDAERAFEQRLRGDGVLPPTGGAPRAGEGASEDRVYAPSVEALRRSAERSRTLLDVRNGEIRQLETLLEDRRRRVQETEEDLRRLRTQERGLLQPDADEGPETPAPVEGTPPRDPTPTPPPVTVPPSITGRLEWIGGFLQTGTPLRDGTFGSRVGLVLVAPPALAGVRHLRIVVSGRGAFHAYVDLSAMDAGVALLDRPVQRMLRVSVPLPFGRFRARVEMADVPGIAAAEGDFDRPLFDPRAKERHIQVERANVQSAAAKVREARGAEQLGERRSHLATRLAFLAKELNEAGQHDEAWEVARRGTEEGQASGRDDVPWGLLYEAQAVAAFFLNRPDALDQAVRSDVRQLAKPVPSFMGSPQTRRSLQARLLRDLAEQLLILGRPPAECEVVYRQALAIDSVTGKLPDDANLMRALRAR
jgi:hypothetical protein